MICETQGYKKVQEEYVDLNYQTDDNDWGIKKNKLVAYEITDWLLNQALGYSLSKT